MKNTQSLITPNAVTHLNTSAVPLVFKFAMQELERNPERTIMFVCDTKAKAKYLELLTGTDHEWREDGANLVYIDSRPMPSIRFVGYRMGEEEVLAGFFIHHLWVIAHSDFLTTRALAVLGAVLPDSDNAIITYGVRETNIISGAELQAAVYED